MYLRSIKKHHRQTTTAKQREKNDDMKEVTKRSLAEVSNEEVAMYRATVTSQSQRWLVQWKSCCIFQPFSLKSSFKVHEGRGSTPRGMEGRRQEAPTIWSNGKSTIYFMLSPPHAPIFPNIFNMVKLEKSEDQIIIKSDPISTSDTSVFAHKKSPSNGF